ncbi:MAG: Ig-like domain-containing protein [Acidobacteria bacterium]|nr:Ig-like domain-containing protein [Acidobacteriota bacterium]
MRVADATADRYTFPSGTVLEAGRGLVVFGGGKPPTDDPAFGASLVRVASTLSLNDGGDTVALKLKVGSQEITLASLAYGAPGSTPAPNDQSLTRERGAGVGLGAGYVAHLSAANAASRAFSPGTLPDGAPFGSPTITRIEIAPTSTVVDLGASQVFTARAFAEGGAGEVEVANVSFAWDVSVPSGASPAPTSGATTTVTAHTAGHFTLRARAGGQQAAASLTVNPPPPVLTRVELSPTAASIFVGGAQQFTARAFDQFDQPYHGATYSFASDDANVARVGATTNNDDVSAVAIVGGRAAGKAHVTATATAGASTVASGAATLNVDPAPPALTRIVVSPPSATIAAGETRQFTARGYDQDDREIGGLAFAWASSDQSVAAISQGGLATAVKAGAAQITAASGGVTSAPATLNVSAPPVAAAGQVIINEALVSFSTSTTQARADFVELYNTTGRALDISGLVVSFRGSGNVSAVSTVALAGAVGSLTTLIPPRGYFLVANAATTFGAAADYAAQGGVLNFNNSTGGIKIEIGGVKLDGLTYQNGGTAPAAPFNSFGEGAALVFPDAPTTIDLIRSPNATDTNNNVTDFKRNTSTASVTPRAPNP